MPFGRYHGIPLADLPDEYVDWLMSLDNLREPLRSAIAREWRARREAESAAEDAATDAAALTPGIADIAAEVVTAGYRALAKQRHPDLGGDVEAMRQLNAAVAALREHIARSTAVESVA
jgi:heterodisulfide reductase subunit A-like polyferredoxin